jgi:hypothetical protein
MILVPPCYCCSSWAEGGYGSWVLLLRQQGWRMLIVRNAPAACTLHVCALTSKPDIKRETLVLPAAAGRERPDCSCCCCCCWGVATRPTPGTRMAVTGPLCCGLPGSLPMMRGRLVCWVSSGTLLLTSNCPLLIEPVLLLALLLLLTVVVL